MALVRLARGIHLPVADADDLALRCAAVIAAAPPGTVASGLTAALLHGLWLPDATASPLDLTVATDNRASRDLPRPRHREIVVHRRWIDPADLDVIKGVPATGLARTWRDLALILALPDLVAAGDSALRRGATVEQLARQCSAIRSRPGAPRASRALSLLDGRSRSRPESHLRVAATHPDLPPFDVNAAVHDAHGQWLGEPDLSLREAKLALEYQGAGHADVDRMRRDMTRLTDFRRAGWEVLLYGPAEVLRRPGLIAPEIRDILMRRAPHLLRPRHRSRVRG